MRHRLAVLIAAILVAGTAAAEETRPIVTTAYGAVRGVATERAEVFWGLPYAASPVGGLRWVAPQKPAAWDGVLDADTRPPMCMQAPRPGEDRVRGESGVSEDCLYLNVWRPKGTEPGDDLPVMVWIHGGSFLVSSGAVWRFDGEHLVQRDVVLVTLNYRLGLFGSFAHPALEAEQAGRPRGHYGLLDQIAALEWVQGNIAAFGGDPDNVTIFGNSAGGASVNALLIAPQARGLFHRAIAQSGGIRVEDTVHLTEQGPSPFATPLIATGIRLGEELGAENAEALRALPAEAILAWQARSPGPYGPVIDGVTLTERFAKPFVTGDIADVDLMFGVDSWEGSILEDIPIPPDVYLKSFVGVDEVRAAFGNPSDREMMSIMFQDKTFVAGARFLARHAAKNGRDVYLYHFSYRPTAARGDGLPGAAHSDEVAFVFGVLPGPITTRKPLSETDISGEDRAMADAMADYWTNFAKTGNPNGKGLPKWPRYTAANDMWMDLGTEIAPLPGFRADDMNFWDARFLKDLQ